MQGGKIAEKGTHADLLELKGEYYDMVGHEPSNTTQEEQQEEEVKENGAW